VAAVCVRDHWDEMEPEARDWCISMLIPEIERDCDSDDTLVQAWRSGLHPSLPAALIMPMILCKSTPDAPHERVTEAIAKSLTHAVSEVIAYAAESVGHYLHSSRRDFMLRCVGALAIKAWLVG
jgi:hypothetical protein